jgi:hypothetical protein
MHMGESGERRGFACGAGYRSGSDSVVHKGAADAEYSATTVQIHLDHREGTEDVSSVIPSTKLYSIDYWQRPVAGIIGLLELLYGTREYLNHEQMEYIRQTFGSINSLCQHARADPWLIWLMTDARQYW